MKVISQTEKDESDKIKTSGVFVRIGIILLILILGILTFGYTIMGTIIKGPSRQASELFVATCMETSFAKFFPPLYISETEIEKIMKANTVLETNEITEVITEFEKPVDETAPDIELVDIFGATYKGKMLIVRDPSRVVVATPPSFGKDVAGEKLSEMIEKAGAVAGINGGGFADDNGVGKGGMPLGVVIKNSEVLNAGGAQGGFVGFDDNNVLQVGAMTNEQMKQRKIRDAVSFGPALIINSNPAKMQGNSGGLNPRTAIGQRADGAVLLLVIDGRQPHSLGANFKDLVDIMTEHGAVNAANLDGGSSSMMYYQGELKNVCASLYGPRKIPTAFVVK